MDRAGRVNTINLQKTSKNLRVGQAGPWNRKDKRCPECGYEIRRPEKYELEMMEEDWAENHLEFDPEKAMICTNADCSYQEG